MIRTGARSLPTIRNFFRGDMLRGVNHAQRAILAWRRIQDDPVSITLYRDETPLASQTVRIQWRVSLTENQTDRAEGVEREVIIFGVKDHPTVADTDIQDGDLFKKDGVSYEIEDVAMYPGEIQARGVKYSG